MCIPGYDHWKMTLPEDQEYVENSRFHDMRKRNAENRRSAEIKEGMKDETI